MKLYRLLNVQVRLKPRLNAGVGASLSIHKAKSGVEAEDLEIYLQDAQDRVLAEVGRHYRTPLQLTSELTRSTLQQIVEGLAIEDVATGYLVRSEEAASIKMAPWMVDWKKLQNGELILDCEVPLSSAYALSGTICGNENPCLIFRDTQLEDYRRCGFTYGSSDSDSKCAAKCRECQCRATS